MTLSSQQKEVPIRILLCHQHTFEELGPVSGTRGTMEVIPHSRQR